MARSDVKAMLGPTNTGKTHYALERLCAHSSAIMGFPLRLLAREAYDRVVAIKGPKEVGLITGEERILPPGARWLLCTAESMPRDREVSFVGVDEAQLGSDPDRGHIFTDRLLHARGRDETLILGSDAIKGVVRDLIPGVEILSRPRFSKLSYAAPRKLSRLPPRSAIIAFSAEEVYAIAEVMRRTRGGAAVVMGNLSPRTRNAQVAMYQAGEVDFIVATDAIGMGLNLDVDHVAFAGLSKFDGQRQRRLRPNELAQIAGRAGRHHRDGSFGVALTGGTSNELSEEEVERIEEHRFDRQPWLYWRNSDLDFADPEALIASLTQPPSEPVLRPAPEADDLIVLRRMTGDLLARGERFGERRTRRLWDACGLPDFRGSGPEFHVQTVQRIFDHIGRGDGLIPAQIIAAEVTRLDDVQGDVAAIANRLTTVRTWSYVCNRADWLAEPAVWAARTLEVEHRMSDTLHKRLMERFVERRAARLLRTNTAPQAGDVRVEDDGEVRVHDEAVGRITGFSFKPDHAARGGEMRRLIAAAEAALPRLLAAKAVALVAADDDAFTIETSVGQAVELFWQEGPVARLSKGRELLAPSTELLPALRKLDPHLREAVAARCRSAVDGIVVRRLAPLRAITEAAFSAETPAALRAFLAPLAEAGGALPRERFVETLGLLTPEQRKTAQGLGLVMGASFVYHPLLLKPEAMRLRLALLTIRTGEPMPPVPMPGLGLLDRPAPELARAAHSAGFARIGDQMIRADLVERIARALHDQRSGQASFIPDARLATSMGLGAATFARVLRMLGFVPAGDAAPDHWRWRGMRRGTARSNSAPRAAPRAQQRNARR